MSLYVFITLIAIVAFLLVLIIMVQNPKGGGLDSTFGGGGTMMGGVQQTTDFLDKATWYLFGIMVVLILLSNSVIIKATTPAESPVKEAIENHIPQSDEAVPTKNPVLEKTQPGENNQVPKKKE